MPPPLLLRTTLSLKQGGGLCLNIWLVLTIHPTKHVDAMKSHHDLAVAIQRNSSNNGHAPQESLQVCWILGDEGRLGNLYSYLHQKC